MSAPLRLDHLVIGAATLQAGMAHVRELFGIEMPSGGAHPMMGTHNRLLRIGDGLFLEIIAIDPEAPDPERPRWFALDDPVQRRRIAERPRLIAWVAGTRDLDGALAGAPTDLGRAIVARRGALSWRIAIRDDGSLPESGALPVLIEWPEGPHPAEKMTDLGIRLADFSLSHPDCGPCTALLERIGAAHLVTLAPAPAAALCARFTLPDGRIASVTS
jgi:hypothetical protein